MPVIRRVLELVPASLKLAVLRRVIHRRSDLHVLIHSALERRALHRWERSGRIGPPPAAAKHQVIRAYAAKFGLRLLVETGTFLGDSTHALRHDFDRIISIELDPDLAEMARRRFARERHIAIVQGDSSKVLPRILSDLTEPGLFWLDAHWSGGITAHGERDTPVAEEIELILRHPVASHVVLIDDARLLGVQPDYPSVDLVRTRVQLLRPGWVCEEQEGIVRLHC